MKTIALLLSYNGENYHGWQTQTNAVSVQSALMSAASSLFCKETPVTGCGRTDAGVHALKYVASLRTDSEIAVSQIPKALNAYLPDDISVYDAVEVPDDFHPVHSCIKKEYTYYIYISDAKSPFYDKLALHCRKAPDVSAMQRAALHFEGTHDFASMRSLGTDLKSTVRTVFSCNVLKHGSFIAVRISANGFLYNMARTIAGTLLDVGYGKLSSDSISFILESRDRTLAGATAPAHALYMTDVIYPEKFGIPNISYGGVFDGIK